MPLSPLDAYQNAVTSLAPHLTRIRTLHRRIASALEHAADALAADRKDEAADGVDRALVGLGELSATCDTGRAAARDANGIYHACRDLLVEAARQRDPAAIRAVGESVRSLQGAWDEVGDGSAR